jgi:4-amino-4-deoxy-L-arabinose transferase-like glycosyltransferase
VTGTENEPVNPWRWPEQWLRDEKFWRDVGSRTLSAIFAAGLIYVFALAAGYVRRPNVLPLALAMFAGLALTFFTQWYGRRLARRPHSRMARLLENDIFNFVLLSVGIVAGVVAIKTTFWP